MEKEENKNRKFWECINNECKHRLAEFVSDNTVKIYNPTGTKYLVNFLRIVVTCSKCDTPQTLRSSLFYEVADWLRDKKINLDWKEGEMNPEQQINLKMHGVSSLDALHKAFPAKNVKLNKGLGKRINEELSLRERQAYALMIQGEGNKDSREAVIKLIAQTDRCTENDAEFLYSNVMHKIEEIQNQHLEEKRGKLVGDDNWSQPDY